jgi:hypothetical protein
MRVWLLGDVGLRREDEIMWTRCGMYLDAGNSKTIPSNPNDLIPIEGRVECIISKKGWNKYERDGVLDKRHDGFVDG